MKMRSLGINGPKVSPIGLGCMSFSGFYGKTDDTTSLQCLEAAHEMGVSWLDTADIYGLGHSETVVGKYLANNPNAFTICTKGGIRTGDVRGFDNTEPYLRSAVEASLKRLGVDYVDLYYIHRRNPDHPIEDMVGALARLKDEGKIGGYGLSEVAPSTIRKAHAEHPMIAVQSEYSLWSRSPDLGVRQTCEELGIAFVAFSPVARGMFGQDFPNPSTMEDKDFRTTQPRFIEPNFSANCKIITPFKEFASDRGWSTAGTAMAWVIAQGNHVLPIPGTRTAAHLAQLIEGMEINLSAADLVEIERILPVGFAHGDRYSNAQWNGPEKYC
jgi:aryl-alcohol dehydrogenase-like predicted oxidoreductase